MMEFTNGVSDRLSVLIGNNTRAEHTEGWIFTYEDPLSPHCTRIRETMTKETEAFIKTLGKKSGDGEFIVSSFPVSSTFSSLCLDCKEPSIILIEKNNVHRGERPCWQK